MKFRSNILCRLHGVATCQRPGTLRMHKHGVQCRREFTNKIITLYFTLHFYCFTSACLMLLLTLSQLHYSFNFYTLCLLT
jgi:hypothetical protein